MDGSVYFDTQTLANVHLFFFFYIFNVSIKKRLGFVRHHCQHISFPENEESSNAHQKEAAVLDVQLLDGATAPPAANSGQPPLIALLTPQASAIESRRRVKLVRLLHILLPFK